MPNNIANKLIPVVNGTAGTPIELHDARLDINNPNDGDILVYDDQSGTFINQVDIDNNTYTTAYCGTAAYTQSKAAACTDFSLKNPSYIVVNIKNANSYNGKITLNVNSTGAKDIWINGEVSSSSNKTLPAGMYIAYYDGSKYLFRTDGKLPIAGGAFGGSYNDLTDTPTIPTVPTNVSDFTNDAGYITLSDVPAQVNADWNATTGAAEILNKPTIPTVPTNVSAFNNDAGYITNSDIPAIPTVPTNVSSFTNDAGYITASGVPQEIFVCNYVTTDDTMNVSNTDIVNAVNNGKVVICKSGNAIWYCNYASNSLIIFVQITTSSLNGISGKVLDLIIWSNNQWSRSRSLLQEKLIDSTIAPNGVTPNLKTINNTSILGNGNISVSNLLPSLTANAGKMLVVNSGTTDVEWVDEPKLYDDKEVVSRLDEEYEVYNNYIGTPSGLWVSSTNYKHWIVPVDNIRKITITANSNTSSWITFLKSHDVITGTPDYATGYNSIVQTPAYTTKSYIVPSDAKYAYFNRGSNGAATPASILLTGIGITEHKGTSTQFVKADGSVDTNTYVTDNNVFICRMEYDNVGEMTDGTTYQDITAAVTAGKAVLCYLTDTDISNDEIAVTLVSSSPQRFQGTTKGTNGAYFVTVEATTSEEWSVTYMSIPTTQSVLPSLSGNANKVLTVNVSETDVEWAEVQGGGSTTVTSVIPSGTVAGTAATSKKVTISGITSYTNGLTIRVKNNSYQSTGDVTLNLNNLGAKSIYYYYNGKVKKMTNEWGSNMTYLLTYSTLNTSGGRWDVTGRIPRNNEQGFGIYSCSTAEATTDKTASGSFATSYFLVENGYVTVKFTNKVPASSTLNIESAGATPIYYRGSAITANVIKAGDTATFIYDGTNYHLVSIDRWGLDIDNLADVAFSGNYADLEDTPTIPTIPDNLGISYGTCDEIDNQDRYVVLMPSGYVPKSGGLIAVKYDSSYTINQTIGANAVLYIANKEMTIRWKGSNIAEGVIASNDTAFFITKEENPESRSSWYCDLVAIDSIRLTDLKDVNISGTLNNTGYILQYYQNEWKNYKFPICWRGVEVGEYEEIPINLPSYFENLFPSATAFRPLQMVCFFIQNTGVLSSDNPQYIKFYVNQGDSVYIHPNAELDFAHREFRKLVKCIRSTNINDSSAYTYWIEVKDVEQMLSPNEHLGYLTE